ncbi:hypothetical protein BCON_0162g00060 [Botryotinia convoluta]|uniref:Uncharacterized protein n=1 Tax=Botryotinia convoluta TaxID=54673 RepID=A0A4Z1HRD3_9HELO|nr:hypothetical protein BCON_0162g00060 [Botryotinia convoluta]
MARYQFSYGDDEDDDSSGKSEDQNLPCSNPNLLNKKPTSPPPQPPTFFNLHPGITPRRTATFKRPFLPPCTPSRPIISHSPTSSNLPIETTSSHSLRNPNITSSEKLPQRTCTCTCTPSLDLLLQQTSLLTESDRDQTARLLALHTLYRESRDERKTDRKYFQKLTHALEKMMGSITWYRERIETQEKEISEAETARKEAETERKEAEKKTQEMTEKMENMEREIEQWRILWEESERGAGGL